MAEANALTDRQREYREVYLRSDHWRETSAAALKRAEHRCQVCNSAKQLDVHHRTYERLGEERPADLTVLCRTCHDRHHRNYNVVTLAPKKQKAKASRSRRKKQKAKAPAPDVHRVSEADRERFDKMREAELERRRAEKRARAERRAEVKQRRLANAKSGRTGQLPRKDVA